MCVCSRVVAFCSRNLTFLMSLCVIIMTVLPPSLLLFY